MKNNADEQKTAVRRKTALKILFVVLMIGIFSTVGYFVFRHFGLDVFSDEYEFDFAAQGFSLIMIFLIIYFAQSLTLNLIPGTTTFFLVVVAYYGLFAENFFLTLIVGWAAVLICALTLYTLGRFAGRKLLFWLFDEEKIDKRLAWFGKNGSQGVPWLFLIPFFPTDLLCLTCGIAKMRFWKFFLIVIVFRPMEVLIVLLMYGLLVPNIIANTTIYEQILLLNVLIVNIVLLAIYHKALFNMFRRTFSPKRYEQNQKELQAQAIELAIVEYKAVLEALEKQKKQIGEAPNPDAKKTK